MPELVMCCMFLSVTSPQDAGLDVRDLLLLHVEQSCETEAPEKVGGETMTC